MSTTNSTSNTSRLAAWATSASLLALSLGQQAFATGQYERDVKIDPVFGLPIPPVHWDHGGPGVFDPQVVFIATCIFTGIFAIAVIWGLYLGVKSRSSIPIFLSLSGIPCVFAELYLDVMGGVVYANNPDSVVLSLMGRHFGWFIFSAWAAYGGLFALASYQIFSRPQLSNRTIWLGLLIVCLGQTVFEETLGHFNGIYYYYGNQPLTPMTQFPWWMVLSTSGGVCFLTALVYRFNASFSGWKAIGIPVIAPFTFCGHMGLVSLPAWIALNSELSWWLTQVLGLVTIAAGLVAFALIMKLVLLRDPLNARGVGVSFSAPAASSTATRPVGSRTVTA